MRRQPPLTYANAAPPPFVPGPNDFSTLLSGLNTGFQGGIARENAQKQALAQAARPSAGGQ